MTEMTDTIAAIGTALGPAGIGIVRLSGPEALEVALRVFRPASGKRPSDRVVTLGHVVDPGDGSGIDEALLTYMAAPRSYTREDVVEVSCHGGVSAVRAALAAVIAAGARQARPGEFTLRAFLSGRLDLAQAEAVLDVVRAPTDRSLRAANEQLGGVLSREVQSLRGRCLDLLAQLEAEIDFAEEDVHPMPRSQVTERLEAIASGIARSLKGSKQGMLLRHGVRLAIVGRPNVGKSSLLNALLRRDRAIVTALPGTTRDVLEESLDLDGIPVVIVDTAGIHGTVDVVEAEGVERSKRALDQADLILFVLDISSALEPADSAVAELVKGSRRPFMAVLNKADLEARLKHGDVRALLGEARLVRTCALSEEGVEPLKAAILDAIGAGTLDAAELPLMANERHREALVRAGEHVGSALEAAAGGLPSDFVSIGLRGAVRALGEITGEDVTEDLLETIFSKFCIGK